MLWLTAASTSFFWRHSPSSASCGKPFSRPNRSPPIFRFAPALTMNLAGELALGPSLDDAICSSIEWEVDVVGLNCSVGPQPMLTAIKKVRSMTTKPLIVEPNAGLPREVDGRYDLYVHSGVFRGVYEVLPPRGHSIRGWMLRYLAGSYSRDGSSHAAIQGHVPGFDIVDAHPEVRLGRRKRRSKKRPASLSS